MNDFLYLDGNHVQLSALLQYCELHDVRVRLESFKQYTLSLIFSSRGLQFYRGLTLFCLFW